MRRSLLPAALGAAILLVLPLVAVAGGESAGAIAGIWLTGDKDGHVQIEPCGDAFCGKLVWVKPEKDVKVPLDKNNPDPALRSQPLKGLQILKDLTWDGDSLWEGGTIYDPKSGKTYHVKVTLVDDGTLKLRGYVGIPLFGRTDVWHRVQEPAAPDSQGAPGR